VDFSFIETEVPYGFAAQRTQVGYKLSNGVVLLRSEQDSNGCYFGAIGLDGIYLHTGKRYRPVSNRCQTICAFQEIIS